MAQPEFPCKSKPMKLKLKIFVLICDTDIGYEVNLYPSKQRFDLAKRCVMEASEPCDQVTALIKDCKYDEAWEAFKDIQSNNNNYYSTYDEVMEFDMPEIKSILGVQAEDPAAAMELVTKALWAVYGREGDDAYRVAKCKKAIAALEGRDE
jgi:hypothetical protein